MDEIENISKIRDKHNVSDKDGLIFICNMLDNKLDQKEKDIIELIDLGTDQVVTEKILMLEDKLEIAKEALRHLYEINGVEYAKKKLEEIEG